MNELEMIVNELNVTYVELTELLNQYQEELK